MYKITVIENVLRICWSEIRSSKQNQQTCQLDSNCWLWKASGTFSHICSVSEKDNKHPKTQLNKIFENSSFFEASACLQAKHANHKVVMDCTVFRWMLYLKTDGENQGIIDLRRKNFKRRNLKMIWFVYLRSDITISYTKYRYFYHKVKLKRHPKMIYNWSSLYLL